MTPNARYPLDGLGLEIKAHWKMYRPRMYRELERAGRLDQAVYEAQERTGQALGQMIEEGADLEKAWEAVREEWAFLPAEADAPEETDDDLDRPVR